MKAAERSPAPPDLLEVRHCMHVCPRKDRSGLWQTTTARSLSPDLQRLRTAGGAAGAAVADMLPVERVCIVGYRYSGAAS